MPTRRNFSSSASKTAAVANRTPSAVADGTPRSAICRPITTVTPYANAPTAARSVPVDSTVRVRGGRVFIFILVLAGRRSSDASSHRGERVRDGRAFFRPRSDDAQPARTHAVRLTERTNADAVLRQGVRDRRRLTAQGVLEVDVGVRVDPHAGKHTHRLAQPRV